MSKEFKVKRYKKIYRKNRFYPWKIALIVVVVAGLFFLGWSLYEPVASFISRSFFSNSEEGSSSTQSPTSSSSGPDSSQEQSSASSSDGQSEVAQTPESSDHAVYVPFTTVSNGEKLKSFLASLDRSKVNAVVFEIKDDSGWLLYQSQLEEASRAGTVAQGAFDLRAVTQQIKEAGFVPVGKMSAFQDPQYPKVVTEASVKYMDTEILWLDNSKELGGKLWLNPYSEAAQNYITNVALEAADCGVEELIVDRIHFPLGVGQHLATYGPNEDTMTKQEVLTQFVTQLEQKLSDKGVKMSQMFTASDLLAGWTIGYQGTPLQMAPHSVVVNFCPSQFGTWFEYNGKNLQNAGSKPEETIAQVLADLNALGWGDREVTAMVQAYDDGPSSTIYNIQVVEKQLQKLMEGGIERFMIYHPDGVYDMAGLEAFQ